MNLTPYSKGKWEWVKRLKCETPNHKTSRATETELPDAGLGHNVLDPTPKTQARRRNETNFLLQRPQSARGTELCQIRCHLLVSINGLN